MPLPEGAVLQKLGWVLSARGAIGLGLESSGSVCGVEAELWGWCKKEARRQPRRLSQASGDDAAVPQVEAMDAENGKWAQGLVARPGEESRRRPNFWCEQPSGK